MGTFAGIKNAKTTLGGIYYQDGKYVSRILAVKSDKNRKGIAYFVVEARIITSTCDQRPPGMKVSWVVTADKDAFLGNVKQFAAEANDVHEDEVDEAGIDAMTDEKQNPLFGTYIACAAATVGTKAGGKYTRVIWERIPVDEWEKKYEPMDKWLSEDEEKRKAA